MNTIKFKRLHPNAKLPTRSYPGDAALDVSSVSLEHEASTKTVVYHTGLAVEIPEGFVGLLFMRSSASGLGRVQKNAVGVIDSGYRGELTMKFYDLPDCYDLPVPTVGDRLGQLVIVPCLHLSAEFVDELSPSNRGEQGYGSTGNV